ncbi:MAG: 30S ribosomal protein S4 [Dehalococcoidia bacterium]|nr:30S ribosomal protein S4 [Dehalococcoidia bacterium]
MARYTGASCRLCRYLGEKLMLKGEKCATPKCPLERRNSRPGRPGGRLGARVARRRKVSLHGLQLQEKQKVRFSYGVLERQFRRFFKEATKVSGVSGDNLLMLLERRLDNVVYCLAFADSRAQSRQVVNHGHILVNGRRVNIPSCLVKLGDVIEWRGGSKKTKYYRSLAEKIKGRSTPGWLSLDEEKMTGKVLALPGKEDIAPIFNGKSIVEYYSK